MHSSSRSWMRRFTIKIRPLHLLFTFSRWWKFKVTLSGNFSHTLCNFSTISSCPEYLYPLDQIGHCLAGKLEDGGAEVEGRDKRPEIRVESPQPSSGEENGCTVYSRWLYLPLCSLKTKSRTMTGRWRSCSRTATRRSVRWRCLSTTLKMTLVDNGLIRVMLGGDPTQVEPSEWFPCEPPCSHRHPSTHTISQVWKQLLSVSCLAFFFFPRLSFRCLIIYCFLSHFF